MTPSSQREKILVVFGTRPEVIKLGPVVEALRGDGRFLLETLATAQHRELLDDMLDVFGIRPDHDLDVMSPNQSLVDVTTKCLTGVTTVLQRSTPAFVLVQGDTTTVLSSALACHYEKVSLGHVEAGLRTADRFSPFPEEMNRRITSTLADLHFAPTTRARDNLLREGVPGDSIIVTGNPVVDAVTRIAALPEDASEAAAAIRRFQESFRKNLLVTIHRRESFGAPLREICRALLEILDVEEDVGILLPVHPNPNVSGIVRGMLGDNPRIMLTAPLGYVEFVHAMKRASLMLSDSGGVQEEAPSLGKPVLVLRSKTERPEGVDAGVARLVGSDRKQIVDQTLRLLQSEREYRSMVPRRSPYGDGRASSRIVECINDYLTARR